MSCNFFNNHKKLLRSGDRMIIEECVSHIERACHINRYKFAAEFVKDKDVLDAGCGTGYGAKILKNEGAKRIVGIDYSAAAIQYAKKKYSDGGIDFRIGDLLDKKTFEALGISKFDIVVCFENIEHVKEPDKLVSNIYTSLKPGGICILSTPNRLDNKLIEEKVVVHEHEFALDELVALLKKAGFLVEVFGQRMFPADLKNDVVEEIKKETYAFNRVYHPERLKFKILNTSVLFLFALLYFKIRKKMPRTDSIIFENVTTLVEKMKPNFIPKTLIIKCLK